MQPENHLRSAAVQLQSFHPHPQSMRSRTTLFLVACALGSAAGAQSPDAGPLLLRFPASTRATALGNAWVAGRDEDVVFYNPAQVISGTRGGFNATFAVIAKQAKFGSISGAYAAGPKSLTLGWGVQFLNYSVTASEAYPFAPDVLTRSGDAGAFSMLLAGGGAIALKGIRIGVAAKYASDRLTSPPVTLSLANPRHDAFLADVGLARNLFGGVAGFSVQNLRHSTLGNPLHVSVPQQASIGWTRTISTDQFDFGLATQVTGRRGWISPGGGLEVGYGWIEGYSAAFRIGARRPETKSERPIALGASFSGDHLTLEYALQFFDGNRTANRMTLRWR